MSLEFSKALTCDAVFIDKACRAREEASSIVMDISALLTAGIADADMDRLLKPNPTRSTALAGSAAISPQRLTPIFAFLPDSIVMLIRRNTAISNGLFR